jgi:hypothetical protein
MEGIAANRIKKYYLSSPAVFPVKQQSIQPGKPIKVPKGRIIYFDENENFKSFGY